MTSGLNPDASSSLISRACSRSVRAFHTLSPVVVRLLGDQPVKRHRGLRRLALFVERDGRCFATSDLRGRRRRLGRFRPGSLAAGRRLDHGLDDRLAHSVGLEAQEAVGGQIVLSLRQPDLADDHVVSEAGLDHRDDRLVGEDFGGPRRATTQSNTMTQRKSALAVRRMTCPSCPRSDLPPYRCARIVRRIP